MSTGNYTLVTGGAGFIGSALIKSNSQQNKRDVVT